MSREEEIRQELFDHTLNGHAPEVKALTEEGLKLGMDPMDILFKALIPSLEEVGRQFKVTRERIRQIEAKALRKMRHPTRIRQLEGFLEAGE